MANVSVSRNQIANGALPSICAVCGDAASHRRFAGISAPSLAWLLFSPLLGLLMFWGYIFIVSIFGKGSTAGMPFCDRHRDYWPLRAWIIIGGFLSLVGLMATGILLTKDEALPHWLLGVAGCWMLLFLPTFIILHICSIRPIKNTAGSIIIAGTSREFAEAVEPGKTAKRA
jgi:hypothetical protein